MAFTHDGFSIPGTHESPKYGEWQRAAQYNSVFGVDGATVLDGGRSRRPIDVAMWIWNGYSSAAQCFTALGNLEQHIGTVGTLVELGNISRSIVNVEFLGFTLNEGPIPPNPDLGWFAVVTLHFLQLGPE